MLAPIGTATQSSSFVSNANAPQPLSGFMSSDQDDQGAFTPAPTTSETEQLLDIDGLLKIEQLIQEIKKDGRLKSTGDESVEYVDNQ